MWQWCAFVPTLPLDTKKKMSEFMNSWFGRLRISSDTQKCAPLSGAVLVSLINSAGARKRRGLNK